jgi:hypothetical protein
VVPPPPHAESNAAAAMAQAESLVGNDRMKVSFGFLIESAFIFDK